jgi:hypothetical protein
MDVCREVVPPEVRFSDGVRVACHLFPTPDTAPLVEASGPSAPLVVGRAADGAHEAAPGIPDAVEAPAVRAVDVRDESLEAEATAYDPLAGDDLHDGPATPGDAG